MFKWSHPADRLSELIAGKHYKKAIQLVRQQIQGEGDSHWLLQQLADLLVLTNERDEALRVMDQLASAYLKDGFHAKAVAMVKRMQQLSPGNPELESKLAAIVGDRGELEARRPLPFKPAVGPGPAPEPAPPGETPETLIASGTLTVSEEAPVAPEPPAGRPGIFRSAIFSDFTERDLLDVVRGFKLRSVQPGEILVSEGEPGGSLFVLVTGTVRVFARDESGRNHQVRLLEEGDFFGEVSLVNGSPRTATITAAAPCDLLELDQATLQRIGEKNPKVPELIREYCRLRSGSSEERAARDGQA